ncbi:uncharacterized protein FA14DRAFT_185052 [Meira miltonrushii]|uniref:Peptidase S9 prolyl oligopeptidase catalytic domain-containing protein n=1 Tax=Meira miltonrushii TaxID=1280837 RepID=A0A316VCD8_9BASI|nr:uncharacterized protein FA14DRAFT_185052 [Meira miltonrushii]PWN33215.1 hypothetical protein FA14DRAFT_185052 [Meira miltonrushii]
MAVGAVMNQDVKGLIGAAFMTRPICDVFQLELRSTIGAGNFEEFGDVRTPQGFDSVFSWSPLQNINPKKQYPAVLLLPGSADETVPPSSSYKMLAQLQHDHPTNNLPLLLYVVPEAGHTSRTLTESVYMFCVMEESLGITWRKAQS